MLHSLLSFIMPVFQLDNRLLWFPHPSLAEESGLLAVGGDLEPNRILTAYQWGIFPWYNPGEEVLWWAPSPRFVIYPDKIKVAKSMRAYFNQNRFNVTYNTAFAEVIKACQSVKRKQDAEEGTWIDEAMINAYTELNRRGKAVSVEVWNGDNLVGGLYGLRLGKVFYGESMFSRESNASKFGFISLARRLQDLGCWFIDCQIENPHLKSLGGEYMVGDEFYSLLKQNYFEEDMTI